MNEFDWQDKQVLVTGAGGFIGSHLVEALANAGARVKAFTHYNSRVDPGLLALLPQQTLARVEILFGDLRDLSALQSALQEVEVVFHLGALISIPYSYAHPLEVVETNILGTMNVLLAARACGVKRLVHTSSSEVYGTALHTPMDENHPLQAQSPYSASKIGADKLAESFYDTYGLPVVTLRPFNTYGPRQSARAVIPSIITQALTRDTLHLGNLDARRDFTYVSDTVSGFLKAASTPGIEGKTFNLGVGSEIRISELVDLILSLIDRPVKLQIDPERIRPANSEVQRLISNNAKAHEQLGWQPEVDFREGILRTIAWISDHLDRYQPAQYQI